MYAELTGTDFEHDGHSLEHKGGAAGRSRRAGQRVPKVTSGPAEGF